MQEEMGSNGERIKLGTSCTNFLAAYRAIERLQKCVMEKLTVGRCC